MNLFARRPPRLEESDLAGRLAALEEYAEYLRQQGEYGFAQTESRLEALENKKPPAEKMGG